jgi:acyl carrier protein
MDISQDIINDDSSPETIETWDSLQHMNLILSLEETFDLQFSDEQVVGMDSVGQIVKVLDSLKE